MHINAIQITLFRQHPIKENSFGIVNTVSIVVTDNIYVNLKIMQVKSHVHHCTVLICKLFKFKLVQF